MLLLLLGGCITPNAFREDGDRNGLLELASTDVVIVVATTLRKIATVVELNLIV